MRNTIFDDSALKKQLAEGDESAFTALYNNYSKAVAAFIRKFVKSEKLAEDINQEVFIKVWENKESISEITSLKAWIFTIARNHTLNVLKRIADAPLGLGEVIENYSVSSYPVEDQIIEKEYMEQVREILESLPPRSREVFRMCREEGRSYDEVTKELGISRNAVKKHMVLSHKIFSEKLVKHLKVSMSILFFP